MITVAVKLYSFDSASTGKCVSAFYVFVSVGSILALVYSHIAMSFQQESLPYVWLAETVWGLLVLLVSFLLAKNPPALSFNYLARDFRSQFRTPLVMPTKAKTRERELHTSRYWFLVLQGAYILTSATFTGVPALMPLFSELSETFGVDALLSTNIQFLQYALVILISVCLVFLYSFRRKDCFVFGMTVLALSNGAVSALFKIYGSTWLERTNPIGRLEEAQLALFLFSFCIFHTFVLPISSIYSVELVRGVPNAVAIMSTIMWVSKAVALVGYGYLLPKTVLNWVEFAVVAAMCSVAAISILFYPETRTVQQLPVVDSSETEKIPKSTISTDFTPGEPTHLPELALFGMDMAIQNFVPLYKSSSRELREGTEFKELTESTELPEPEKAKYLSKWRSALPMVTAASHFSGVNVNASLLGSFHEKEAPFSLMSALWSSASNT